MNDLISVIIPVYNAEKYLPGCIGSVLSQNDVASEIILIDDGSTDNSSAICDSYAAKHETIRVFHTKNHGVSHARNIGLDNASGDYITFLDADDALTPDALKTLLRYLREVNADIAVGKKRIIERSGNLLEPSFPAPTECWQGSEGLEQSLKDHPATYSVWGKLYRSGLLEDIRFEEGRAIHEDSFFVFLCMLKEPKIIVKDIAVIDYHVSKNSASRSAFSDKFFDILYFAGRKNEIVHSRYPAFSPLTENLLLKAHLALLNNLSKTREKKYRDAETASLDYVKEHKNALIAATDNDIRFFRIITHGLYYPRKYLKLILRGDSS